MYKAFIILLVIFSNHLALAEVPNDCPHSEEAVTTPSPVNTSNIISQLMELKTTSGLRVLKDFTELKTQVQNTFDTKLVKTRIEQFYTLLYLIQNHTGRKVPEDFSFDAPQVQALLVTAGVFSDLTIPKQMKSFSLNRSQSKVPRYTIGFAKPPVKVVLNNGEGFALFRNGLCQRAKHLEFGESFGVSIRRLRNQNIKAYNFRGVNLVGDFGNRGLIDVDINYVSIRSVEFYRGSDQGKVTAYIADKEFEKNQHNPLLRLVSKFAPDKSVQPIDW